MQKITPFLWFDKNAEEAMRYYVEVFNGWSGAQSGDNEIVTIKRYPEGIEEGPMAGMGGQVLTGVFKLAGQTFMALDGGPIFKFTEAISMLVECGTQEEIDYYWSKLSAVPESEQCGWCKDKFGLSWQIVPKMQRFFDETNPEKAGRTMQALLKMKKIDIATLENA